MPITLEFFDATIPVLFRAFLNDLWDRSADGLMYTFSNIRPESRNGKKQPTLLERRRNLLETFAGCKAIGTVAKKAYKTRSGRCAIEHITKVALHLPEMLAVTPVDGEDCHMGVSRYRDALGAVDTALGLRWR